MKLSGNKGSLWDNNSQGLPLLKEKRQSTEGSEEDVIEELPFNHPYMER
jgi:hypothetical protein